MFILTFFYATSKYQFPIYWVFLTSHEIIFYFSWHWQLDIILINYFAYKTVSWIKLVLLDIFDLRNIFSNNIGFIITSFIFLSENIIRIFGTSITVHAKELDRFEVIFAVLRLFIIFLIIIECEIQRIVVFTVIHKTQDYIFIIIVIWIFLFQIMDQLLPWIFNCDYIWLILVLISSSSSSCLGLSFT